MDIDVIDEWRMQTKLTVENVDTRKDGGLFLSETLPSTVDARVTAFIYQETTVGFIGIKFRRLHNNGYLSY